MNVRHVFETPQATADACAREILQRLSESIALNGRATLAVSGGSTPRMMFDVMTKIDFDWAKLHLFWVDERPVPPDHKDSNFRMTQEALLSRVSPGSVHRILGELPPAEAAERYRQDLQQFFDGPPIFDIVHLGMGSDAHTASLFPGLPEIEDREGMAASVWVDKLATHRITLLPKAILDARQVVMLVCGTDKAVPLDRVFNDPYDPLRLPAQLVHRNASLVDWFLDRAAQ